MTEAIEEAGLMSVAKRIAAEGRVSLRAMLTERTKSAARARHRFCAVVRASWGDEDGLSYPEIGRLVGLDHTTVMVAVRKYENRLAHEYEVRR